MTLVYRGDDATWTDLEVEMLTATVVVAFTHGLVPSLLRPVSQLLVAYRSETFGDLDVHDLF